MYTKTNLEDKLAYIENEENYYAMFNYAYDTCIEARGIAQYLFNEEALSDEEYHSFCERIYSAKQKMIQIIREWTIKALERSTSKLDKRQIVYSVFSAIFKDI